MTFGLTSEEPLSGDCAGPCVIPRTYTISNTSFTRHCHLILFDDMRLPIRSKVTTYDGHSRCVVKEEMCFHLCSLNSWRERRLTLSPIYKTLVFWDEPSTVHINWCFIFEHIVNLEWWARTYKSMMIFVYGANHSSISRHLSLCMYKIMW